MKKIYLMIVSLLVCCGISIMAFNAASASSTDGTPSQQADDNPAERYYITGTDLDGLAYNTKHPFNYNEANNTWTYEVSPTASYKYFCIYKNGGGNSLCYDTGGTISSVPVKAELKANDNNFSFKTAGTYLLTISELGGVPYLAISKPGAEEPEETAWTLSGITANEPTINGNVITWNIENVKTTDSFNVTATTGSTTQQWGYPNQIAVGQNYTLTETGDKIRFDAEYNNVVLTWNTDSHILSFTGDKVNTPGESNSTKYSIGGRDDLSLGGWNYNTNNLFKYDADNNTWTYELKTSNTYTYFAVYNSSNEQLGYESGYSSIKSSVTKELKVNSNNFNIALIGTFTLTITEENGNPYMAITIPEGTWSIEGLTPTATTENNNLINWTIGSVSSKDNFTLSSKLGNVTTTYGTSSVIAAGEDYTLIVNGGNISFDKDYNDVVISFNTASKTLSFTGTEVDETEILAKKYSLGGYNSSDSWVDDNYTTDQLFSYNPDTKEWTKEIKTVGANKWFAIWNIDDKKLTNMNNHVISSAEFGPVQLSTQTYNDWAVNFQLTKRNTYLLTITEESGTPYLKVKALGAALELPDNFSAVWKTDIKINDMEFCYDGAQGDLVVSITPSGEFWKPSESYLETIMTSDSYKNFRDNPTSQDSWFYEEDAAHGFYHSATATAEFGDTNNELTLKVPCSGKYTLTLQMPEGHGWLAETITKEITIMPTFDGVMLNWGGESTQNPGTFLLYTGDEENMPKADKTNITFGGFGYEVWYKIDEKETPALLTTRAAEEISTDGYTLYSGKEGVNLSNASKLNLIIQKNGIYSSTSNNSEGVSPLNIKLTSDMNDMIEVGVDEILDESASAETRIYTLGGIEVNAENLQPGIYIVVKGNKTEKIKIR